MPRRSPFEKNAYYHIFNRWFQKQILFFKEKDYKVFLARMFYELERYEDKFDIISYSLLPNHFHLVIRTYKKWLFPSFFLSRLCAWYATYYVLNYGNNAWIVFQGRFKSKLLWLPSYLYRCIAYVNTNAQKHWYVDNYLNWPYSSVVGVFSGNDIYWLKNNIEKYENDVVLGLE